MIPALTTLHRIFVKTADNLLDKSLIDASFTRRAARFEPGFGWDTIISKRTV
jgi:hypothetical protein